MAPEDPPGAGTGLVPAERLAGLSPAALAEALRPLFEDASWLAARLAGRDYATWEEVIDAAAAVIEEAPDADKAEVLRSHPRLGAEPDGLRRRSEASWREQDGGRDPGAEALDALRDANDRYEARFGFPFVDWVAGRPLEKITAVIQSRLDADPAGELARAGRALIDIARDRLATIRRAEAGPQPAGERSVGDRRRQ